MIELFTETGFPVHMIFIIGIAVLLHVLLKEDQ